MYTTEEWEEVEGYPGYSVSTEGRVMSYRLKEPKELAQQTTKCGYKYVRLSISKNKSKYSLIHRLVAKAFVPNPDNKPQVNHIDGDKSNNKASNLEWVSAKENTRHAYELGLRDNNTLARNGKSNSKPVSQIDVKTGRVIATFPSVSEVRHHGFDRAAVQRCCYVRKDTHKGFRWRFVGEESRRYVNKPRSNPSKVFIKNGELLEVFESAQKLADTFGVSRNSVYRAISQSRKLLGKYEVGYWIN